MVDFNINPIGLSSATQKPGVPEKASPAVNASSFGQWLEKSLIEVNRLTHEADQAALKLATGQNRDIHGTMISMQKADVALNLMMEVRNKIISAYEEVKRMQF